MRKEDDLELLRVERAQADREYNDALTRLDRAIQQLPGAFPQPPPSIDEHQITPLNTLWKIDAPPPIGGIRGRLAAAIRRAVAPLFEQQQAFNSAIVDHINRISKGTGNGLTGSRVDVVTRLSLTSSNEGDCDILTAVNE